MPGKLEMVLNIQRNIVYRDSNDRKRWLQLTKEVLFRAFKSLDWLVTKMENVEALGVFSLHDAESVLLDNLHAHIYGDLWNVWREMLAFGISLVFSFLPSLISFA